jgi:hypothetical protein
MNLWGLVVFHHREMERVLFALYTLVVSSTPATLRLNWNFVHVVKGMQPAWLLFVSCAYPRWGSVVTHALLLVPLRVVWWKYGLKMVLFMLVICSLFAPKSQAFPLC